MLNLPDFMLLVAPYVGSSVAAVVVVAAANAWQYYRHTRYALGSSPTSAFLLALPLGAFIELAGKQLYASGLLVPLGQLGTIGSALINGLGSDTCCVVSAMTLWLVVRLVFLRSNAVALKASFFIGSMLLGLLCAEAGSGTTHYLDSTLSVFGF